MKRNQFIASVLTLATAPLFSLSQIQGINQIKDKGFKIKAGDGRKHGSLKLKGVNFNVLDVKISGSDTQGNLAIFEQTSLSPGKGTPLHFHYNQDEIFYVIDGAYYFQVGDERYQLQKGDSIFLPKKVPHAWTQVSNQGKMTVTLQPAGMLENFCNHCSIGS
jgi:quercetin dioxygenase-like cupin family protein